MKKDPLTDDAYNQASLLVKQIRSGRKIFKLFQWFVELKDLVYEIKDFSAARLKSALYSIFVEGHLTPAIPALDNLLEIIAKTASVGYYFLDNLFWVISVGMVGDKMFSRKKWKKYKDIFSLVRNWFPLFRSIILYRLTSKKLEKIDKELSVYDNQVIGTTCFEATELMRKYINLKPTLYD